MKAHDLRRHQAQVLAEVLLEVVDDPDHASEDLRKYIASNGSDHMRGIPAIGRNCAGAIPGTSPHGVLVAKEERRRRR